MRARILRAIASAVFAASAAVGTASAETAFDITTVPRIAGATEMIVAGPNVIYVSPDAPEATGKKLRELLQSNGWFHFDEPPFEDQDESDFLHQEFIRGANAIGVYVVAAPAKNNRTSVQYSITDIPGVLPIPKDATRIAYSTRALHLDCFSSQKPAELLEFYATELGKTGWQRWTMPNNKVDPAKSDSVRTHFVSENKKPLVLKLSTTDAGSTYVALEPVTHEEMMADYTPKAEPPKAEAEAKPAPPPAPIDPENDNTDEKFADLVQGLIKEALKPVPKPAKKEAAEKAPVVPLAALANNTAPLPLPGDATEIEHDTEDGTIEFHSAANVPSLTAFYREQMKSLGWKEKRGVLNSDRLQGLDFSKGKSDRITFTIHNMTDRVEVTIRGDSLKTAEANPTGDAASSSDAPSSIEVPAEPVKQYALDELEAIDSAGLPVPKPNNAVGRTKSKFFYSANAFVQASIETVVAFYRRELPKREFSEDTAAASITADAATLKFTTKEGPAVLKVTHKDGQSNVELTVRQKALAEASGLMPKAGYVRIMFGNIEETPGEITIGGKTFKVKAGERAEDAKSSPSIELKPGKHAFTVQSKGKPAQKDEAQFGADEIWGILIGPGGGLPLPMY